MVSETTQNQSIHILLVEDNEADILIAQRAFQKIATSNKVHYVRNGEEAIAYLSGQGTYSNRDQFPWPQLILLDINMPRKNGFDVLNYMKEKKNTPISRILMLTSSRLNTDIEKSYEDGACAYFVKPIDAKDFTRLVNDIDSFWSQASFPENRC